MDRMARRTKQPEALREFLRRSGTIPLLSRSVWPGPALVERDFAIVESRTPSWKTRE